MRKTIKIGAILLVLVFATYCEKETKDYRDKYTGSWEYVVVLTKLNIDSIGQFERDTIHYLGKISHGNAANELNIQYTEGNSIILKLNEAGELSGFPDGFNGGSGSGEFEGNYKIHLHFRWGGLGGFLEHTIDGIKN